MASAGNKSKNPNGGGILQHHIITPSQSLFSFISKTRFKIFILGEEVYAYDNICGSALQYYAWILNTYS